MPIQVKQKKKQKLRNNEYYDIQEIMDKLYQQSVKGYKFNKLYDLIISKENIELAYRNIKKNTGSKTKGVNGHTIEDVTRISNGDLVEYVRRRLQNYHPHKVRRVEIPKPNGKTRPLGIPTIEDRIIQQCIKQILEPICEAKFHNHSYGFRPNRSTEHAKARLDFFINRMKLTYVVDIDIKGFFDNVDHSKLLKQMWTLGIQDKQLLCIISKMLKAPIEGIGIPTKGTPQGGILSPLLSNIVLNELDWWISSQWETHKTHHEYTRNDRHKRALKTSELKEMYIVRYADDFKVVCKNRQTAIKIYNAVKLWLNERLHLEISEEKSKITNLKKNYTEFLGFKIKAITKKNKYVAISHMSDKAKVKAKENIKKQIKELQKQTTFKNAQKLNSIILGMHNYYKIASHVNEDFSNIHYSVKKNLHNRLKDVAKSNGIKPDVYNKFYGGYNFKTYYVAKVPIFPIAGIRTKIPLGFSQDICNYTKEGREKIHDKQQSVSTYILKYIMENPIPSQSIEYNDNRISLYVGQKGICPISKEHLTIGNMECHHKTPRECGGTDEYSNLIFLKTEVHKLIHATSKETINKYLSLFDFNKNDINKINKLRLMVGNCKI